MKILCFRLFLTFSLGFLLGDGPLNAQLSLPEFADSLFRASIDSSFIAGGAALVYQGDKLLLDKSYGYASLELEAPMPEEAKFEIGSVTKQFTAAAIVKLHQMGKLSLDDDFTKYVDFDARGRTISIRRLLDHTSGIASYTEIPSFWSLSLHRHERDTMLRLVEEAGYLFEPGEALIYNNSAYFFLGLIIEKVSGKTYEEFLREQFFDPLQMDNTYYCSTSRVVKGKVYGYNYTPGGLQQKPYLDHTWPYAAGSLCSTTADLLKWMQALHRDRLLGTDGYQLMTTPRPLKDGSEVLYAMGLVNEEYYGHRMIHHGGGIHGFLSESRYFPEADLYVICLISTTGPHGAGYFADHLTWQLLEREELPASELDVDLKALSGNYSGQVRGHRVRVEVKAKKAALHLYVNEQESPDILEHYLGKNTWWYDGERYTIEDGQMRILDGYSYYVLKRF